MITTNTCLLLGEKHYMRKCRTISPTQGLPNKMSNFSQQLQIVRAAVLIILSQSRLLRNQLGTLLIFLDNNDTDLALNHKVELSLHLWLELYFLGNE